MVPRIIAYCAGHRGAVLAVTLALAAWAVVCVRETPLDAIPDLTDPQVIVFTDWMGRGPDLVEDQVTYPLVRALQSTPAVRTVRGYSMFGMSFVYVIFREGTELYWARSRVLEQLSRARALLPPDAAPELGPDATGIGWVYQYALVDRTGRRDLAELRALQDFTVRPALQAAGGVAEVASFGGYERQFQVVADPHRLAGYGLTVADLARAVRDANAEVGGRVVEMAGREYVLRGRGYATRLEDLGEAAVTVGRGGVPVRVRDVASLRFGPELRRGAADLDGRGEAVGGVVVMRVGANALDVIRAVRARSAALALPEGVELVPTYDRAELIEGAVGTLRRTLLEEGIIVALVCVLFLAHLRSALVAIVVLPLAVLLAFIPMRYLGLSSNIMSLGGIAIAVGELSDAAIVLIENAHVRLAEAPPGSDRRKVILDAAKEVGAPIFFSLLLITVSFLPIFTLAGQAGRLFRPLAFTKTFSMLAAAALSITVAPPLMVLLLRGRIRPEAKNPVARALARVYAPVARLAVRRRVFVLALAALATAAMVPVARGLGSEFMPPLDEGSLLVMPTTFPGISIETTRQVLQAQDRILRGFPEVASVHGKAGRAETATDPAQLDMIETVVALRPRERWPLRPARRWWSGGAPGWLVPALRTAWPDRRPRTLDELARDLSDALRTPGYQLAVSPPIRTRVDMLTTGVRTPVGVKVLGGDLREIERLSVALEGILREVPGTRSVFAERQSGREYLDVTPDRAAISRYGLSVRDVLDVVESALGGANVSTVVAGRGRYAVNVRLGQDFRADPQAIREVLVPVPQLEPLDPTASEGASGAGTSPPQGSPMGGAAGSMGAMGAAAARATPPSPGAMAAPGGGGPEALARWAPRRALVPLGALADVRVAQGPPMIKDEDGVLAGYVFVDVDTARRDLGGWVEEARALVQRRLPAPAGYQLVWTGQYEFQREMEQRMRYVLPLTLVLIVALLRLSMRGWAQTWLVLASLPFALIGSFALLALRGYHLSTAVWVGLVAVGGVAAETGTVMVVYLDEATDRLLARTPTPTAEELDAAIVQGASARVRPLVMTVATTVLGLLPLLWGSGVGADVSARTAAPVVGGLWSCMVLTLGVLPAMYALWRHRQRRRGTLAPRPTNEGSAPRSG
ncbi:MAG: efflux RND transporter permease subunit [Deltaproteobacteria bacterium]|nr:efflux RND transporter permease subunit [Deltaproteobacteria bacterium]